METVELKTKQGQTAVIYLQGAHVANWKAADGEDLMFLSKQAIFAPGKAIRGGVPVCFPQFGMMGPMPQQHGFARNTMFEVEGREDWKVVLLLKYNGTTQAAFPHPFELRVIISLCDDNFQQEIKVTNTGAEPLPFTCALHTYYKVSSIDAVKVVGLKGVKYLNNLEAQREVVEEGEAVTFSAELDRVYCGAPDELAIHDCSSGRVFEIKKVGFPDAVVWNPWVAKSKAMADFGDEEYKEMLCIEPAVAGSGAVTVAPGATWSATQLIRTHKA